MFIVSIVSNPKDKTYRDLIDLAFEICDEFILVVRKDVNITTNVNLVLEKLQYSLKEIKEQSEWSGTRLGEYGTAQVYYYNTDNKAKKIIKDVTDSLHSWVQPNLPEDLCFIKNHQPWLINTSHEYESDIVTDDKKEINRILEIKNLKVKLRHL